MRRPRTNLPILCCLGAAVLLGPAFVRGEDAAPADEPLPHWIWVSRNAQANERAYFRKTFEVPGKISSAQLVASCDQFVGLYLNGEYVVQHDYWEVPVREDVTARLREGTNVIVARCTSDSDPAALLLRLSLRMADGTRQTIVTDSSWLASAVPKDGWRDIEYDLTGWHKPHDFGRWGIEPWGRVPLDGQGLPAATAADKIRVPVGFRVERLYSVPKERQGSWVALAPDDKGRLIVSDQFGSLYRVTPGRDAHETKVERLEVSIGGAQGLLFAYDSLYVSKNGEDPESSGLYRLRDTNGDDQFDEVTLLKKLVGYGEHGPHALRLGPDGLIYLISGNHTKIPDGLDPRSPHRNWAEDLLLPRNPDGMGHATGVMAPGGWLARTDKDGKHWELICGGLRNTYDIAFNPDGELFTYDADMEYDLGSPWYRPTRINHLVSAAEFGWRYGTGKWPAYYPDSHGAVVDIGIGSPTGIDFGTGAKFPARYQRALLICDWTYGKIYAVHLKSQGASYTASFELFVEGRPLAVTDLAVHSDGALYFTIGGRRTQSGLYRVRYVGPESTKPVEPQDDPAALEARATRRMLESFHGRRDPQAITKAWPYLNSPDRAIRYAGRVAIEHQEPSLWQQQALDEPRVTAAIEALLALTRVGGENMQDAVLVRLNRLPLERLSEAQLLDVSRVYQLAFIRLGGRRSPAAGKVIARLSPLFPAESNLVNRELCQLLVYLEAPGVVARAMKLLESSETQEDQMFYIFVLRNLSTGWTSHERKAYFSWLNLAEEKYKGGMSFRLFIQQIRRDAVDKLSEDEKTALADVIEGRQQVEAVKLETTRQFVHNWQMEDLLPLLDQVEHGRSFARGKLAYDAAQCGKCHRFGGEGGATGPDLTGVGSRFNPEYLLEALIVPSKMVSDQYQNALILTAAGEVISGRVINEDADNLLVRTSPFARELTEVAKGDIEDRRPSPVSEMPQGLVNVLTKEEILDLIAYMRSAGRSEDPSFGGK